MVVRITGPGRSGGLVRLRRHAVSFVVSLARVPATGPPYAPAGPREHGPAPSGYAPTMSQPLTDPTTVPRKREVPPPDDAPEPEPFEPSVTNPDADGIDEPS
ncbi:MAG: hypothetical protein JWR55_1870 [Aeromicrobium sp.]|nr:hypothetical protein [Aeromicrobium sp.]